MAIHCGKAKELLTEFSASHKEVLCDNTQLVLPATRGAVRKLSVKWYQGYDGSPPSNHAGGVSGAPAVACRVSGIVAVLLR